MRLVSPLLGRKYSPGRLRRHREAVARAKADGKVFGPPADPETHIETRICQLPSCGKAFPFKVTKGFNPRANAGLYCCQPHALQHTSIRRRKCEVDHQLLHDLYVEKRMTTIEIAAMLGCSCHTVRKRLEELGIARRRAGTRPQAVCKERGCNQPVLKLPNPDSGGVYGTRCEPHYRAHRRSVHATCYLRKRKAKGDIPVQILRALATGLSTSYDIALRLGVPIQAVASSLWRMEKRGEVESFGLVKANRINNRQPQKLWRLVNQQPEAIVC